MENTQQHSEALHADIDRLATSVLRAAGTPARVTGKPYIHSGRLLWSCDVDGASQLISLTLICCGENALPNDCTMDEMIAVANADVAKAVLLAVTQHAQHAGRSA